MCVGGVRLKERKSWLKRRSFLCLDNLRLKAVAFRKITNVILCCLPLMFLSGNQSPIDPFHAEPLSHLGLFTMISFHHHELMSIDVCQIKTKTDRLNSPAYHKKYNRVTRYKGILLENSCRHATNPES